MKKSIKIWIWVILILFVHPAFMLADAETNHNKRSSVIIVGGDYDYPPYEFLDQYGHPAGYNVELTKAIADVMGIEIQIRLDKWSRIRKALENGEVDVLQGMVYSRERSRLFDFSAPHTFINQSIFARKGSPPIQSVEELRGKELIVQKNGIMHDYLLSKGIKAKLTLTDTHVNALRMLSSGKSDYALVANLPGLYAGRELKLTNIIQVSKPVAGMPYCYAANKDSERLLAVFSEGLAILKNTGRHQEIYDKWLGIYESPPGIPWGNVIKLGLLAGGPLLCFMGAIMAWNRSLKRQVARRTKEISSQQEQLRQADKLASLGTLVSGVAHEINNPNSSVLMNLSLIEDVVEDSLNIIGSSSEGNGNVKLGGLEYSRVRKEIPLILKDTRTAARKIRRIVEDLKDFARQGNSEFTGDVDLNEVVETSVRLMENTIKKSTNNFQVLLAPKLPRIKANAQRIEQVVINLIMNSCQALTTMDQAIKIQSNYLAQEKEIVVIVEDEGAGIDKAHISSVFDPFFTTKRENGGTGLGLAVSATIVKEHGGTLSFQSTVDKGTSAIMRMPIERKGAV